MLASPRHLLWSIDGAMSIVRVLAPSENPGAGPGFPGTALRDRSEVALDADAGDELIVNLGRLEDDRRAAEAGHVVGAGRPRREGRRAVDAAAALRPILVFEAGPAADAQAG